MLPKINRLSKDRDISQVFLQGRSFFSHFFTVRFKPGELKRFAFVVSNKVSKLAVRRNRIKRIVREQVRQIETILLNGDYVIIVKPSAKEATDENIIESFKKLMEKSKLTSQSK